MRWLDWLAPISEFEIRYVECLQRDLRLGFRTQQMLRIQVVNTPISLLHIPNERSRKLCKHNNMFTGLMIPIRPAC